METRADGFPHHREMGSGPPMLLLAGGPGFAPEIFLPWLAPLTERFRLYFVDLPGMGQGSAAVEVGDLTHGRWIEACEALREHLEIECWTVLAHSYGGLVALEYAIERPRAVSGLVLLNAYPALDPGEAILARLSAVVSEEDWPAVLDLLTLAVPDEEVFRDRLAIVFPYLASGLDRGAARRLIGGLSLRSAVYRHACATLLPRCDLSRRLAEIAAPTLVIGGEADPLAPPTSGSGRLAHGIPGARFLLIPGCRHYAFIEAPEVCLAAIAEWSLTSFGETTRGGEPSPP